MTSRKLTLPGPIVALALLAVVLLGPHGFGRMLVWLLLAVLIGGIAMRRGPQLRLWIEARKAAAAAATIDSPARRDLDALVPVRVRWVEPVRRALVHGQGRLYALPDDAILFLPSLFDALLGVTEVYLAADAQALFAVTALPHDEVLFEIAAGDGPTVVIVISDDAEEWLERYGTAALFNQPQEPVALPPAPDGATTPTPRTADLDLLTPTAGGDARTPGWVSRYDQVADPSLIPPAESAAASNGHPTVTTTLEVLPPPRPASGWYPDPLAPDSLERYYDGEWQAQTREAGRSAPPA